MDFIGGLTGVVADSGQAALIGYKKGFAAVNAAGGVLGCQVVVNSTDDRSDPPADPALTQSALTSGKYKAYYFWGFGAAGGISLISRKDMPYFGNPPDTLANPNKNPYVFSFAQGNEPVTEAIAKRIAAKGYHHVAVVRDSSAFGDPVQVGMTKGLGDANIAIVEKVPSTLADATPVANAIKAVRPDAIFADEYGATEGALITAFRQAGLNVPIIGGVTAESIDLSTVVSAADIKDVVVCGFAEDYVGQGNPGAAAYIKSVRDALNGKPLKVPPSNYIDAYVAARSWAAAVNGTKGFDPQKMSAWMESHGKTRESFILNSTNGTTGFSSTNHILATYPENVACGNAATFAADGQLQLAGGF